MSTPVCTSGDLVQALLDRRLRQQLAGDEHVLDLLAQLLVVLLALLHLALDHVVHARLGDRHAVDDRDVVLGIAGGERQHAGQGHPGCRRGFDELHL